MDLSFLDNSSNVTPLLVRLYDSHTLYGLAKDKKPSARAELTAAVTELLNMELSERESELIADVLISLIRQAETDLKQAMAERLSVIDNVPLRLALQMANDEIAVAGPMLRNSNVLGDLDLIYIVKSKSADYWRAIAERKKLSDKVMNILAETQDFETALTLTKNNNITLSEHTLGILSSIAQGSDVLAQPLLRRDEVDAELARALYQYVGDELKRFITQTFPLGSEETKDIIDETVEELKSATQQRPFYPSSETIKTALGYQHKGHLDVGLMLSALQRAQIDVFVAQFAAFCGLTPETTLDILSQKNGQGLAIACRAVDIDKTDFVSMFLLTNRVRNMSAMVDVGDMGRAVEYFNKIDRKTALGILNGSASEITKEDV